MLLSFMCVSFGLFLWMDMFMFLLKLLWFRVMLVMCEMVLLMLWLGKVFMFFVMMEFWVVVVFFLWLMVDCWDWWVLMISIVFSLLMGVLCLVLVGLVVGVVGLVGFCWVRVVLCVRRVRVREMVVLMWLCCRMGC